jgi:hypothetical protein
MFSLISSITQQFTNQSTPIKNPPINAPSKNLPSIPYQKRKKKKTFSKSFIFSGKQRGGATVLGEGRDIVTRETCVPTSMNIKQLRKRSCVAFCFLALFCGWGHAKLSP